MYQSPFSTNEIKYFMDDFFYNYEFDSISEMEAA